MQRKSDEAVVDVVKRWVRALVDRPELVQVCAVRGATITILEVSVGPEDVKRIIGRGGRTADALRVLLKAIGGRRKTRYDLQILEPGPGKPPMSPLADVERADRIHAFEHAPLESTRGLVLELTGELVDHREVVQVDAIEGSQLAVLELRLAQEDVPRVLGRQGRTILAIRELLRNLGCKSGRKFVLDVVEPVERVG